MLYRDRVFTAVARADKPFDFAQDIGRPWHTATPHRAEHLMPRLADVLSVGWARGLASRRPSAQRGALYLKLTDPKPRSGDSMLPGAPALVVLRKSERWHACRQARRAGIG